MEDRNASLKQFAQMIKNSSKKNSNNNINNTNKTRIEKIKNLKNQNKQKYIQLNGYVNNVILIKLQETDTILDVDSLIFQILEIIHGAPGNIESTLMATLGVESFEFMSLSIEKRSRIVSKTKKYYLSVNAHKMSIRQGEQQFTLGGDGGLDHLPSVPIEQLELLTLCKRKNECLSNMMMN